MESHFDIDNLINESFNKSLNLEKNTNQDNLIKYELCLFTDGAHERVKKRSSFGIYIICKDKEHHLYKFNKTKIIKKINKDCILYNIKNNQIIYHSLFDQSINDKCKYENCNYYAIYTNNENDIGEYCKIHKQDQMIQSIEFKNYDPTNIRAEGLALIYALIYLKIILIDNNLEQDKIIESINNIQFEKSEFKFREYIDPNNPKEYKYYQFITDSEFWINVITKWSNNWIKQNIVLEKKNIDLIYYINYLLNLLYDNKIIIHFKFIKAHADKNQTDKNNEKIKYTFYQKGNIMADKLANIAKENINYNVKMSFE
jgi:ribonuclease HI